MSSSSDLEMRAAAAWWRDNQAKKAADHLDIGDLPISGRVRLHRREEFFGLRHAGVTPLWQHKVSGSIHLGSGNSDDLLAQASGFFI